MTELTYKRIYAEADARLTADGYEPAPEPVQIKRKYRVTYQHKLFSSEPVTREYTAVSEFEAGCKLARFMRKSIISFHKHCEFEIVG